MSINISLCMIVKNEEKLLGSAISSARAIMGFSDIVVVDTGSTDSTKEIAVSHGARVFDFEWVNDFSAARNFAADQANNDWILMIDADEEIIEADLYELSGFISNDSFVGIINMIELPDNDRHGISRLYNRKTHKITGSIHEQIAPLGGKKVKRAKVSILVRHSGYIPEIQKEKGKYERNVSMLEKALEKSPNDSYYLYHLGKSHFVLNRDLEKACFYFEKALSKSVEVDAHYFYDMVECYGYALLNTEKFEEALNLLNVYSQYYNDNPNFRFLAAHILQNNNMLIEAVECYESCIGADIFDEKGVTSYLSYYNIGVILECVGMFGDAIEMYKSCGDYEPALARLTELLGEQQGVET